MRWAPGLTRTPDRTATTVTGQDRRPGHSRRPDMGHEPRGTVRATATATGTATGQIRHPGHVPRGTTERERGETATGAGGTSP